MKLALAIAVLLAAACATLRPDEVWAPVNFHGDGGVEDGCICGGNRKHLVCECDPEVVKGAVGVWK